MSFKDKFFISWKQFTMDYKLIKHNNQNYHHSIYGQYCYYLNLPTKKRIFVKQVQFQNEEQLNYILSQVEQSSKFNSYEEFSNFLKYCVKIDGNNNSISHRPYMQKSGSIFLQYEGTKTVQQIVSQMLINKAPSDFSPPSKSKTGLSPSKYVSSTHQLQHVCYFSESTLHNIMRMGFNFIKILKQNRIASIKSLTFQMIQMDKFGQIDEKCKFLLYPFVQNEIVQMLRQNCINIEQSFVGELILNQVNQVQGSNRTTKIHQDKSSQMLSFDYPNTHQNNLFSKIILDQGTPSPTFNFSGKNNTFPKIQNNLYIQLIQSLGLLLSKLMTLAVGKNKYFDSRFYKMDSQYDLIIDFDQIRQTFMEVKKLEKYPKHLINKIQKLVFGTRNVLEIQEIQHVIYNEQEQRRHNLSIQQKQSHNRRVKQSRKSIETQSTPSKRVTFGQTKLINRPRDQLNQTLNQRRALLRQKSKSRSGSKQKSRSKQKCSQLLKQKSQSLLKYKSRSLLKQKLPSSVQRDKPKQNNIMVISNHASSNKKPLQGSNKSSSTSRGPSNKKQLSQDQLKLVDQLKQKILYDQKGHIYPNIIQKHFRDGSTYIGQYDPKLNTKQGNGLYFYFQGDIYGGTWRNDQLNGLGIYIFVNGDSYQGQVNNGQKDGFGVYAYANRNLFKGYWKDDKKQGNGQYIYANGDSYMGIFKNGKKQGKGTYLWLNGDVYEGSFLKNMKHGQGVFKQAKTDNTLEGTWQNDKLADKEIAKITYHKTKNQFQGQITKSGVIEGKGYLNFGRNGSYNGSLKYNKFQGQCVINFPNGDIYKGQMRNNLFQGYGQYYFAHKKLTYVGTWTQGLQHGEGKVIFQNDGSIIITTWQNGKYSTRRSVIAYANLQKYQGDINEKGRHGRGKYFFKDGRWIQGQFQNNQLVHVYSTITTK